MQQTGRFAVSLSLLMLMCFAACTDVKDTQEESFGTEDIGKIEPILPAFEVAGTYKGILPCASCPGIQSTIIFTKDHRVEKTDLYKDKDENSFSITGTWEMETPYKIKVNFSDQIAFYALHSDVEIELLRLKDKADSLPGGLNYKLQKEPEIKQPSKLTGSYIQHMDGGYIQLLDIEEQEPNQFKITISNQPESPTGCSFSGYGKFTHNRIEVNLSGIESSLKGVLSIDVNGDSARVFTTTEAQRYDLMFFCSGGTSLAGFYLKQ